MQGALLQGAADHRQRRGTGRGLRADPCARYSKSDWGALPDRAGGADLMQVLDDVSATHPEGGSTSEHALRVPAPSIALRAKASLAPDDGAANRALAVVVRRLYSLRSVEGPHRWLDFENATTESGCAPLVQRGPLLEELSNVLAEVVRSDQPLFPWDLASTELVEVVEGRPAQQLQIFADLLGLLAAGLGHLSKNTEEMGPADLPLIQVDPGVARPTIRDQGPREVLVEQLPGDIATPAVPDEEGGGLLALGSPQPPFFASLLPAGLVGGPELGRLDAFECLGVCGCKSLTDSTFNVRDRPEKDAETEEITEQFLGRASGEPVVSSQQSCGGFEPGARMSPSGFPGAVSPRWSRRIPCRQVHATGSR